MGKETRTKKMMTFVGRIYKNENSQNVIGVDAEPRMYVVPIELKEMVEFSENAASVERGFWRDAATGLFIRSIPGYKSEDAEVDFVMHKKSLPYEAKNRDEYPERMMHWTAFHSALEFMWNRDVDSKRASIVQVTNKLSYIEIDFTDFIESNVPKQFKNVSETLTSSRGSIEIKEV